jgi:hypothetical protein
MQIKLKTAQDVVYHVDAAPRYGYIIFAPGCALDLCLAVAVLCCAVLAAVTPWAT